MPDPDEIISIDSTTESYESSSCSEPDYENAPNGNHNNRIVHPSQVICVEDTSDDDDDNDDEDDGNDVVEVVRRNNSVRQSNQQATRNRSDQQQMQQQNSTDNFGDSTDNSGGESDDNEYPARRQMLQKIPSRKKSNLLSPRLTKQTPIEFSDDTTDSTMEEVTKNEIKQSSSWQRQSSKDQKIQNKTSSKNNSAYAFSKNKSPVRKRPALEMERSTAIAKVSSDSSGSNGKLLPATKRRKTAPLLSERQQEEAEQEDTSTSSSNSDDYDWHGNNRSKQSKSESSVSLCQSNVNDSSKIKCVDTPTKSPKSKYKAQDRINEMSATIDITGKNIVVSTNMSKSSNSGQRFQEAKINKSNASQKRYTSSSSSVAALNSYDRKQTPSELAASKKQGYDFTNNSNEIKSNSRLKTARASAIVARAAIYEDNEEINVRRQRCPTCNKLFGSLTILQHAATCGDTTISHSTTTTTAYNSTSMSNKTKSNNNSSNNRPERQRKLTEKMAMHEFKKSLSQSSITSDCHEKSSSDSVSAQTSTMPTSTTTATIEMDPLQIETPVIANLEDESSATIQDAESIADEGNDDDTDVDPDIGMSERAWKIQVFRALARVRRQRRERKKELMKLSFQEKSRLLAKREEERPPMRSHPRLKPIVKKTLSCLQEGLADGILPHSKATTVMIKKHFVSETTIDTSLLEETQDDGNDSDDGVPFNNFRSNISSEGRAQSSEKTSTETTYSLGVGHEAWEVNETIDEVLRMLQSLKSHDKVQMHLADLMKEDIQRIKQRYDTITESQVEKMPRDPYDDLMSSFRDLFCRRCLTYDCNIHGLADTFCPELQGRLALKKELGGFWEQFESTSNSNLEVNLSPFSYICPLINPSESEDSTETVNASNVSTKPPTATDVRLNDTSTTLTETQKIICKRLSLIFKGDIQKVAEAMALPESDIAQYVETPKLPVVEPGSMARAKRSDYYSMKNYNATWLRRIEKGMTRPFFFPCHHAKPCSEATCSCIENGFFCTKHCVWGSQSKNFYRGCNCAGKCTTKTCSCFASNRECDPDLCKACGACTDPPKQRITNQRCCNDNMGMRRHCHTLLGKSDVAGWGLFTKDSLKRGDFIDEYIGELIMQDEAEKRGAIYDKRNLTYLFDLSTDYAVDSMRKGNKTRFMNHSNKPNVEPRLMIVNGDFRIGFFAKTDIKAQTELFFDYGEIFTSCKDSFIEKGVKSGSKST